MMGGHYGGHSEDCRAWHVDDDGKSVEPCTCGLLQQPRPQQRQDSVTDQLRDLIPFANFHGMYDAADYLQNVVDRADDKSGRIVERPPLGGRRADFDPKRNFCHE